MPKISALILSTLILLFTRIGIANATANVGKVGPVADFRANSMTGTSLFTVAFIDISTGGVTSWSWDFEDGSKSVERHPVHTFAAPGIYSVRLLVVGPQGADTKIKHITVASPQRETASHTNANTDLNLPPSEWSDIGEVQADYDWTRVTFKKPLLDPVVVARPIEDEEDELIAIRIRNVDPTGFEICIQVSNSTQIPTKTIINYIAMERGRHRLPDDTQVEAGQFDAYRTRSFKAMVFSQAFEQVPQVAIALAFDSEDEEGTVPISIQNISSNGFDFRIYSEKTNPATHRAYSISYLAWEPSPDLSL